MNETFDMSVDYEVLCNMEAHLERIDYDLIQSIQSMAGAIRDSSEYLSGYEKIKEAKLKEHPELKFNPDNEKYRKYYTNTGYMHIVENRYEKC